MTYVKIIVQGKDNVYCTNTQAYILINNQYKCIIASICQTAKQEKAGK